MYGYVNCCNTHEYIYLLGTIRPGYRLGRCKHFKLNNQFVSWWQLDKTSLYFIGDVYEMTILRETFLSHTIKPVQFCNINSVSQSFRLIILVRRNAYPKVCKSTWCVSLSFDSYMCLPCLIPVSTQDMVAVVSCSRQLSCQQCPLSLPLQGALC